MTRITVLKPEPEVHMFDELDIGDSFYSPSMDAHYMVLPDTCVGQNIFNAVQLQPNPDYGLASFKGTDLVVPVKEIVIKM